MDILAFLIGK